ncbi:MAG TPA: hypothetical protein PLN63_06180 [Paludibacteraceae bacterium]|jgi:hypothetical protein|nr:hypothetical protein [Paludibacteraceae bacterium]HPH63189.1 hypothetical protein [Paludibacteraceae bacterium]HQF50647.1 hypothetical protein [Paludibacteraceae bacterium]
MILSAHLLSAGAVDFFTGKVFNLTGFAQSATRTAPPPSEEQTQSPDSPRDGRNTNNRGHYDLPDFSHNYLFYTKIEN